MGLAAVLMAAGCTGSADTPAPAPGTVRVPEVSAPLTSPAPTGGITTHTGQPDPTDTAETTAAEVAAGEITIRITGQDEARFEVNCTRTGDELTVDGESGTASVNMVLAGGSPSAVYTMSTKDGTTIFQARRGLKDSAGASVGRLEVGTEGGTYSGTGVFVLTKMDAAGVDATPAAGNSRPGRFTLTCGELGGG